jgi:hypothetical protein
MAAKIYPFRVLSVRLATLLHVFGDADSGVTVKLNVGV